MYIKTIILILGLMIPLLSPVSTEATSAFQAEGQEVTETMEADTLAESEGIEDSSIWALVGQAGGIRYPIYAILIIGLFLISWKLLELYMDRKKSTSLRSTPFEDLNLNQINKTISRQNEHMLSVVMAKLVNVFQTNRNADYLHDEISNYNQFQQTNFNSFRNRIDFLSDTAGALGLLGTVWGMFMVFSSGTLEKESILAGMGIALMSTLLGLIVSIILNFSSTITEGYFTKSLEKVTSKADELRFRLIELSEDSTPAAEAPRNQTQKPVYNNSNNNSGFVARPAETKDTSNQSDVSDIEAQEPEEPEAKNHPKELVLLSTLKKSYQAGETAEEIEILLKGTTGDPIADQKLDVVLQYDGKINGKPDKAVITTDEDGRARFSWKLNTKAGTQKAGIRCKDKEFNQVKKEISVDVTAAEPSSLQIKNNHQAAMTGSDIPKPAFILVKDKYGNPVPDTSVKMTVTMGNGTFSNGKETTTKKTGTDGTLEFKFTLGDEPGFNAVDIEVPGHELQQKFQAVGQEVTA